MAKPFPDVTIPGVPATGDCCLWQVHKFAEGHRNIIADPKEYECETGSTERGIINQMKLLLQTRQPNCNETAQIPEGSPLVTSGPVIRRTDGFGIYSGSFTIHDPATQAPLFAGQLELYDRVGTHQPPVAAPGESCSEHIEGWLVGQGVRDPHYALHLAIAGLITNPNATTPPQIIYIILNGVLIHCP